MRLDKGDFGFAKMCFVGDRASRGRTWRRAAQGGDRRRPRSSGGAARRQADQLGGRSTDRAEAIQGISHSFSFSSIAATSFRRPFLFFLSRPPLPSSWCFFDYRFSSSSSVSRHQDFFGWGCRFFLLPLQLLVIDFFLGLDCRFLFSSSSASRHLRFLLSLRCFFTTTAFQCLFRRSCWAPRLSSSPSRSKLQFVLCVSTALWMSSGSLYAVNCSFAHLDMNFG